MEERAPRNIRDIAHLYISRPRAGARRIAVVGIDRECFPGFHAANLASALSRDGYVVRLFEKSGLLANAARFLALPPRVYAAPPSRRPGGGVRAIDGVDVWFAPPPDAGPNQDRRGPDVVDLVHAPPLDRESGLEAFLEICREATDVVLLARGDSVAPAAPRGSVRAWRLLVGQPGDRPGPDGWLYAGSVARWEKALGDPVPAVVRDPHSRLARAFRECGRRLVTHTSYGGIHESTGRTDAARGRTRPAPAS